jgi:hypothetical protein
MSRRSTKSQKTTTIRVNGEIWKVPRGFGRVYARAVKADLNLIRAGKPGEVIGGIRDVLALVGYEATIEQVADWSLRKRVEASIYAATEYARAGDNPVQRHPRPSWLPADPWKGPQRGEGVFGGPGGTPIKTEAT